MVICDCPPQTSRKVGIFCFEIQGKIHGKVVFWWNWDSNRFEMFISFLKLLAKYQLSFLLPNIWKLTFSRCSCTGNIYKMKTLRHVFSVLRILTCSALKNRNSTSGCRINLKQFSIQSWRLCSIWICNKIKLTRARPYWRFVVDDHICELGLLIP